MSTALDVGIGIALLYLLLALLVVTIQELIAGVFNLRAKNLYTAIDTMLRGGTFSDAAKAAMPELTQGPLAEQLYQHPLLRNLVHQRLEIVAGKLPVFGNGLPSYIPSKTFALALLDVLRGKPAGAAMGAAKVLADVKGSVDNLSEGELKRSLQLLLNDVEELESDLDKRAALASHRIEGWFNDRMARASGWYKRKAQLWSMVIALGASVAFNADTIRIADNLWTDAELRAAVVAVAEKTNKDHTAELLESGLPIGWRQWDPKGLDYLLIPLGWLITALAVSLGAPFWFDVLSKATRIRSSGAKVSPATGEVENG